MRYIKAILYTALMSILFLTGIVVVEGIVGAQEIDRIVGDALDENNYHILLSGSYQSTEPIVYETASNDDFTIVIRGYETMSINDDVESYFVEFNVEVTHGALDTFSNVAFKFSEGEYPIKFLKFLNREIYIVVNEFDQPRLLQSEFFEKENAELTKLVITYDPTGEEIVFELPLNLSEADFALETHIANYKSLNNGAYPESDTSEIQLLTQVKLNTGTAVIITMIVEFILIGALTVYIYIFRPKRKLGKKNPSVHLQKDIEKLKKDKEEKTSSGVE